MSRHTLSPYAAARIAAWLFAGVLLFAAHAVAAARFADDAALIDHVVELMDRRLALMPEVAAIKFQRQKPIADPAREREVLEQSVAEAQALHLDPNAAREFFSVQIAMARAVQEGLFARWRAGAMPPGATRDLARDVRPALDALGRELLPAVYLASSALVDGRTTVWQPRLSRLRHYAGINEEQLGALANALAKLRITEAPNWETLRKVGVLRIGTTGDYAPFSSDDGGDLRGLDVELGQALAKAWGVSAIFVRTSWPTLMDDLRRHRFDVATSGITMTDERRRQADFSVPYLFDGKTPIARRENASRFASLEQIDQPGVRVIVKPGGTNERFARERLHRATLVVHADNRTIFDELIAGRADVMITDGIEVRLQTQRHPELRGTMAEQLTRSAKAFMLAPKSELTARVDAWLGPMAARGEVEGAALRAH